VGLFVELSGEERVKTFDPKNKVENVKESKKPNKLFF